jgi:hypothetical protein
LSPCACCAWTGLVGSQKYGSCWNIRIL